MTDFPLQKLIGLLRTPAGLLRDLSGRLQDLTDAMPYRSISGIFRAIAKPDGSTAAHSTCLFICVSEGSQKTAMAFHCGVILRISGFTRNSCPLEFFPEIFGTFPAAAPWYLMKCINCPWDSRF